MQEVYILDGARTPFTEYGGSFKEITDIDLAVHAAKEALNRSQVPARDIHEITFGNVIHTNISSSYLARHIGLKSGVPEIAPALTVNRLCGSGMQAVISSVLSIKNGDADVALAGGTENMSQSPHVLRNTRWGSANGSPPIDDMLWATLTDSYIGYGMGLTAENLAERYSISREEQDQFAVESHMKAAKAAKTGRFAKEIVPIPVRKNREHILIERDEHIRPETSFEKLSKLKPAFKKEGTTTAGNASGINDGAATVVLVSETYASQHKKEPLARIVSWGIAGVNPATMGIGPVPAMKIALKKAELSWNDIGLIELNEAFSAQSLAVLKELDLNPEIVNVNGGAIALGHPVGASGARISYSLALEMKLRNVKYGIASLCIGGGQGIALLLEKV